MVVRWVAGPETAVQISRSELSIKWHQPGIWLIAAGVALAPTLVLIIKTTAAAHRQYSPIGHIWSIAGIVLLYVVVFGLVLAMFALFSRTDAQRGSNRVRAYAFPGAAMQARYTSNYIELTTATGITHHLYTAIKHVRIADDTVTFINTAGYLVLPRELAPRPRDRNRSRLNALTR
ncbi:hypothetical protein [Nocardia sp. NBC_01327]|uniref:hypothetical protein n=1 Tax=Nocardia sp. NBC_01327 TaxID=2903593 RepID=UPI002E1283A6|nr:hypothetical protein OG326_30760 [Nocardia sp. NBC_01327]